MDNRTVLREPSSACSLWVKGCLALILASVPTGSARAQQPTVSATTAHHTLAQLEYAQYRLRGDTVYCELYIGVSRAELQPVKQPNGSFRLAAQLELQIRNSGGVALGTPHTWTLAQTLTDTVGYQRGFLVDAVGFARPAGQYEAMLKVRDEAHPTATPLDLSQDLALNGFSPDTPDVSTIELAAILQRSNDQQSQFYKNTLLVVPQVPAVYSGASDTLNYYVEFYNLNLAPSSTIYLRHYIRAAGDNQPVAASILQQRQGRPNGDIVHRGHVDLSTLPTGSYVLRVAALDSARQEVAARDRRFFVYHPEIASSSQMASTDLSLSQSEFATLTEAQLALQFSQIEALANTNEKRVYRDLKDLDAKRQFLFDFWRRRDPDPNTSQNEAKIEFDDRVLAANQKFRTAYREGWRTDRGRVYLQYGAPSETDPHPSERGKYPYETWRYDAIEGGVMFVFLDRSGFSDYRLIHSTARSEVQNPDWEKLTDAQVNRFGGDASN